MTSLASLWSRLTGFAAMHALNGILGIVYTVVQTLIFARVLDTALFSKTIAIVTVGIYAAPFNQAVARANFVLLTSTPDRDGPSIDAPESAIAFHISQLIMLALAVLAPTILDMRSFSEYITMTCFLVYILFSTVWIVQMQTMMIATGNGRIFEYLTFLRKAPEYSLLIWLWLGGSFLVIAILLAITALFFNVLLIIITTRSTNLFGISSRPSQHGIVSYLKSLWISVQATFGEWLALSGPYIFFTVLFGVGPALIAIDTLMKLVRICVTISRNLSEIVLMRVANALRAASPEAGRRYVLFALGGGWAVALAIGTIGFFNERLLFSSLLGPNNTLPIGAGKAVALAMFSGCGFAIGSHLVGHTGKPMAVRRIMSVVIAVSVLAGLATLTPISVLIALWLVAIGLALSSGVALHELSRLVRSDTR